MALGVLNWTPATFWDATPYEFNCAIAGWNEKNGGGPKVDPLTHEELEELMKLFPD